MNDSRAELQTGDVEKETEVLNEGNADEDISPMNGTLLRRISR